MEIRTRNVGGIVSSFLFLLSGIGIMIGGIQYKVGTFLDPLPGFFPFIWGFFIIVLSSTTLVRGWLGLGKRIESFGEVWRPAILMGGMMVYVMILDPLGFILATALVAPFILLVMKVKSWKALILCSFLSSIGSYVLFSYGLHLELPKGILEFVL